MHPWSGGALRSRALPAGQKGAPGTSRWRPIARNARQRGDCARYVTTRLLPDKRPYGRGLAWGGTARVAGGIPAGRASHSAAVHRQLGYLAIFVLMVAESACIPVPSEVTMVFGGALAAGAVAGAHLNLPLVITVGGGQCGRQLHRLGCGRLRGQAAWRRWGRYLLLRPSDIRPRGPVVRPVRHQGRVLRPAPAHDPHLHLAAAGITYALAGVIVLLTVVAIALLVRRCVREHGRKRGLTDSYERS